MLFSVVIWRYRGYFPGFMYFLFIVWLIFVSLCKIYKHIFSFCNILVNICNDLIVRIFFRKKYFVEDRCEMPGTLILCGNMIQL